MESFFYPNSIVIFGVSKNEKKSGNRVLKNILNFKKEDIYLIHHKTDNIYGIKCYRSLLELPTKKIDLAIIILPVELVLDALEECLKFEVKSIIVESGALYIKGQNDAENLKKIEKIKAILKEKKKRELWDQIQLDFIVLIKVKTI